MLRIAEELFGRIVEGSPFFWTVAAKVDYRVNTARKRLTDSSSM